MAKTGDRAGEQSAPHRDVFCPPPSLAQLTAHLQATIRLSPAQIDRVLAAACLSITDTLAKAKEALESEDYPALGRAAHTLKGTLLQCGLNELAAKAEEIYLGSQTHSDLNLEWLLEQLNSRLAALISTKDSAGTN